MNRREILKYTALITGSAICTPLLSSVLSGCSKKAVEKTGDYIPQFFNQEEMELVKYMVDTILPKTDSPSASDVGVHLEIDSFVAEVYPKKDQESYTLGFASLKKYLDENSFSQSDEEGQTLLLQHLDKPNNNQPEEVRQAFLHFKQQTITFYLSTEEIATTQLNYLPVPGPYEACISLSEVGGKAWAI